MNEEGKWDVNVVFSPDNCSSFVESIYQYSAQLSYYVFNTTSCAAATPVLMSSQYSIIQPVLRPHVLHRRYSLKIEKIFFQIRYSNASHSVETLP